MISQRKPTNNDIVEKIQEMFLVLQSVDVKWTTPEIMSNFLKCTIKFLDEDIENQINTIVNLTSTFLIENGLVEKGIIDDSAMKDHYNKPGYKMCVDFSLFQLKYDNGQIIKKDIIEHSVEDEYEE